MYTHPYICNCLYVHVLHTYIHTYAWQCVFVNWCTYMYIYIMMHYWGWQSICCWLVPCVSLVCSVHSQQEWRDCQGCCQKDGAGGLPSCARGGQGWGICVLCTLCDRQGNEEQKTYSTNQDLYVCIVIYIHTYTHRNAYNSYVCMLYSMYICMYVSTVPCMFYRCCVAMSLPLDLNKLHYANVAIHNMLNE